MILGRILCYILVVFEQDIVFGAYLTLQAESREDVDVFKKKEQAFISIWSWNIGVQSWKSFILILGRILCYILVIFEQDIVFGAYLTLQAESREDVDVFKKKSKLLSQFGAEILEFKVGRVSFLSSVGFCVTFWSFLSKILYLQLIWHYRLKVGKM